MAAEGVGRAMGVMIPAGQRQSRGTPHTLSNFVEMKTYAVEWTDDDGRVHVETMHRVGKSWYRAPNGENYAATLMPVAQDSWLVQLFEEKLASKNTATVPTKDVVDILPTGG